MNGFPEAFDEIAAEIEGRLSPQATTYLKTLDDTKKVKTFTTARKLARAELKAFFKHTRKL